MEDEFIREWIFSSSGLWVKAIITTTEDEYIRFANKLVIRHSEKRSATITDDKFISTNLHAKKKLRILGTLQVLRSVVNVLMKVLIHITFYKGRPSEMP